MYNNIKYTLDIIIIIINVYNTHYMPSVTTTEAVNNNNNSVKIL